MSRTDLQRWNGPTSPQELYLYAQTLAGSTLLPAQFRKNPENTFWACEFARALDIPTVVALAGIHVMDGKPSAAAGLMSALIRRDGHKLRTTKTGTVRGGDYTVTTELIRVDDPEFVYRATWDLDRACRATLIDRLDVDERGRTVVIARTEKNKPGSWEKYTEAMLKARTVSEVGREGAEDCLCGIRYTPEELGADVDEDGNVVPNGGVVITSTVVDDPQPAQPWPPQQRQPSEPAGVEPVVGEPPVQQPQEPVDDGRNRMRGLIVAAATEADPDVLRAMYKGAGKDGLNMVVTDLVPSRYTDRTTVLGYLDDTEPITLREWFTTCSKHLTDHGGRPLGKAADEGLVDEAGTDSAVLVGEAA